LRDHFVAFDSANRDIYSTSSQHNTLGIDGIVSQPGYDLPRLTKSTSLTARDRRVRDGSSDTKESFFAHEGYQEGRGKRVGYDNLTAIDWIFEYAKEKQRLRHLRDTSHGWIGSVKQLADGAQIWIILVCTGVAVGTVAAAIDVVSDWLGDMKTGICSDVESGGKFYLNKYFCCWGVDGELQRNETSVSLS